MLTYVCMLTTNRYQKYKSVEWLDVCSEKVAVMIIAGDLHDHDYHSHDSDDNEEKEEEI